MSILLFNNLFLSKPFYCQCHSSSKIALLILKIFCQALVLQQQPPVQHGNILKKKTLVSEKR